MRKIRADIISKLNGVRTIDQIPFTIVSDIHQQAVSLLGAPQSFPFQGLGCGGDDPSQQPAHVQETEIGQYDE